MSNLALISSSKCHLSGEQHQKGSSLIEVLVSILLMSFGILAMAGMQAYAVSAQKNAANRGIASALANEFAEVVRLNQTVFASYDNTLLLASASLPASIAFCSFPTCTAAALAGSDISRFMSEIRRQLPQGGMKFSIPIIAGVKSTDSAEIWIMWQEPAVLGNTQAAAESGFDNCPAEAKAQATLPRCFYMKVQLQ